MKLQTADGSDSLFRKSTLVWLFNEKMRVSPDRLGRFIVDKQKSAPIANVPMSTDLRVPLYKMNALKKGDFIIMKEDDNLLLGEVLNFMFLGEPKLKDRRFNQNFCLISSKRNIGVSANWYLISDSKKLLKIGINQHLSFKNYCYHIHKIYFDLKNGTLSVDVKEVMLKLQI